MLKKDQANGSAMRTEGWGGYYRTKSTVYLGKAGQIPHFSIGECDGLLIDGRFNIILFRWKMWYRHDMFLIRLLVTPVKISI